MCHNVDLPLFPQKKINLIKHRTLYHKKCTVFSREIARVSKSIRHKWNGSLQRKLQCSVYARTPVWFSKDTWQNLSEITSMKTCLALAYFPNATLPIMQNISFWCINCFETISFSLYNRQHVIFSTWSVIPSKINLHSHSWGYQAKTNVQRISTVE